MARVLSDEFNEQVKRTVRESIRRERSNTGRTGRWHKKGGGGETRYMAVLIDDLPADPGIYPTGTVTAASDQLTTSASLAAYIDDYVVIIEGAGASGGILITTITAFAASVATLADAATTAVTDAAVTVLSVADAWVLETDPNNRRLIQKVVAGAARTEPVVNRFRHIELLANTLIEIKYMGGEWRVSEADCDASTWEWPVIPS
jgi:hypothetical protein